METAQIQIPDTFVIVVKKMIPEVSDIKVYNYETIKVVDVTSFGYSERFKVGISLSLFPESKPKGGREYYTNTLNELFKMTYGSDMSFVQLFVNELIWLPQKSNRDKFYELFGL